MEGVGVRSSALSFCSQPDNMPNQSARQQIPQALRGHRRVELGTGVKMASEWSLAIKKVVSTFRRR